LNVRVVGLVIVAAAALATAAAGLAQQTPTGPAPPPPPYPGLTPPAANAPIVPPPPSRGRARGTPKPSGQPEASSSPPPPQFTNLSGVWEVQAQPGGPSTVYTHLRMQQNADNSVTGYWERGKEKLPFNGNFDGRQFRITVQDGKAQETFAGYEDNFSDMVGLIDMGNGKPAVPFTASHRAKTDFLNNINIGPGIGNSAPQGRY
jgi:hypothetical protein